MPRSPTASAMLRRLPSALTGLTALWALEEYGAAQKLVKHSDQGGAGGWPALGSSSPRSVHGDHNS